MKSERKREGEKERERAREKERELTEDPWSVSQQCFQCLHVHDAL